MQGRSNLPGKVTPREVSSPNTRRGQSPSERQSAINADSGPRKRDAWAISPREHEVPTMPANERRVVNPDTVRGHINNARCALLAAAQQPHAFTVDEFAQLIFDVDATLRAALDVYDGKVPPPSDILAEFHRGHPDAAARERAASELLQQPSVRAALARARAERGNDGTKA